jgi:hypothetical protein
LLASMAPDSSVQAGRVTLLEGSVLFGGSVDGRGCADAPTAVASVRTDAVIAVVIGLFMS